MGLDAVELLIAIEDEFEIGVSDEDACDLTTPYILSQYIHSRVRSHENSLCPSQRGFYKIRKLLVSSFGASRSEVKLDSKLESFFSDKPKLEWSRLEKGLDCGSLPRLVIGKKASLFALYLLPLSIVTLFLINGLPFVVSLLVVVIYYIFGI